jgi:hypothetical protein
MKTVGYTLGGQDNDTYMFSKNDAVPKCNGCGFRLDFFRTNPAYRLANYREDISHTYDGQTIVSKAFRDFYLNNGYHGARFAAFENDSNHFHLKIDEVVSFDAVRRKTRFENLCPQCGNYESVVGATPAYLLVDHILKDGFFRSDLLFASGNEKHPITVVGVETKAKLKVSGLRGLEFSPVFGMD